MTKYVSLSFGLILHAISYIILFKKIEPLYIHFYSFVWWSYIVIADSVFAIKNNRFLVLNRTLPLLIIISAGFWCIFELINIIIQNWFYINLPPEIEHRYTGYVLSYGTVIPAIYVTKELLHSFIGKVKIKAVKLKNYHVYATATGFIMLLLTLLLPEYFFALAWVSLGLIVDGYNYKIGNKSFARDLENGRSDSILSSMAAGLFCGILWEFWNNWAITKWIYTVPFFEDLKLFEMPVLGYLGFIVFGLETVAFVNFLENLWKKRIKLIALTVFMASICAVTFYLIDRYTVFSYLAKIYELDFIEKHKIEAFARDGIKTSYKIDLNKLNKTERDSLKLVHLKGLGLENFRKLREKGIVNVYMLQQLDEKTLSNIIGEKNLRRVRVYLKAARKYKI